MLREREREREREGEEEGERGREGEGEGEGEPLSGLEMYVCVAPTCWLIFSPIFSITLNLLHLPMLSLSFCTPNFEFRMLSQSFCTPNFEFSMLSQSFCTPNFEFSISMLSHSVLYADLENSITLVINSNTR